MIGTIVNFFAVIAGALIGVLLKKTIPDRIKTIYFQAIGLFTVAIGISMLININHLLIVVISLAIGSLIGEWLQLELYVNKFSNYLKSKFKIGNEKFNEGLISSFLLFCMGSMTIIGAIQEGVDGSSDLLFTKSLMDFFSSIILASAFGIGVAFSAILLLVFQGGITLLASVASPFFSADIIQGLTNIGGILLIGLAINILEIKSIRIMNMLPSLLFVVILLWIFT